MQSVKSVFSDRHRGAKIGIALALLVMGFSASNLAGKNLYPSLAACRLWPERHDGRRIWVPYAHVDRVEAGRFDITDPLGLPARVEGDIPGLEPGETLNLVATFDRSGVLHLDANSRWRRPTAPALGAMGRLGRTVGLQRLHYIASTAVLIWIAWLFHRSFRGRLAIPAFIARETTGDSRESQIPQI